MILVGLVDLLVGPDIVVAGVRRITTDYVHGLVVLPIVGLAVGTGQYALLRNHVPRVGWWIGATAAGWILASALNTGWPNALWLFGLTASIPQWLVLRRRLTGAGWWIIATGALWMAQLPVLVLLAFAAPAPLTLRDMWSVWALAVVPASAGAIVLGPLLAGAAGASPDLTRA